MSSPPAVSLIGHQRPRLHRSPPRATVTAGDLAADLYEVATKQPLDEWQRWCLQEACGETPAGTWASTRVGIVVSRQNGKTEIIIARILAGLFLFGEQQIVYTAHLFATAKKIYRKIRRIIEHCPDLHRKVKRYIDSHGSEGIELKSGAMLSFVARTKGAARGDSVDLLILDEAFDITEAEMAALTPTQMARPNGQRWFASSAPNAEEHSNARVFAKQRDTSLAGAKRSTWLEWSAPLDADPDAPETAAMANPALGSERLTMESIEDSRRDLTDKEFRVEILGMGDWPKPEVVERIVERPMWQGLLDRQPAHTGVVALGLDMSPDQRWCDVGAASLTATGAAALEVGYHGPPGPHVIDLVLSLVERWDPVAVVLDPSGPIGSIVPELVGAGIEPETTSMQQMAAACGGFVTAVLNRLVSHTGDPLLDDALAAARKRDLPGGAWALKRVGAAPISPLVSVLLARWGLVTFGSAPKKAPPAAPLWTPTTSASSETYDLATMSF